MRLLLVLAFIAAASVPAAAQKASFDASVDKNRLALGDQLEVTFTLNGSSSGNNFRAPAFNDFSVLSGPNQSTSMQIVNGSVSSSIAYTYVLQPKAVGKFTIPPATIEYGGKQLGTQPIAVEVTKGAPPSQAQKGGNSDISRQIGDNLFMRVTLDKTHVYQGEQITATYKIYTRVNIINYGLSKVPALTGFWSEDLDVPKQIQLRNEVVNGRQYNVGILKKVALYPQRSGTLDIDPMEVECVVQVRNQRRSNDIFDQFFNDPFFGNVSNVNYKVRSDPAKITVAALPNGAPKGFAGAVGKFSMETWLDKHETKTNEPVTLKVKISGRGNLKLIEAPTFDVPPDLERYDPKISDNISKQGDVISGSRTFEYLLIPRHAGQLKISSFPFAYFDPERKAYVPSNSPEFTLNVGKGSDVAANGGEGINKEDVKLLGEDIRFIKSGDQALRRKGETFVGSPAFYTLTVSPFLAFIGFVFYTRRRERVLGDVVTLKNRKARKMAQKRLVEAKKFLHAKKREEFYAEISRALWGYIGDKLGIPPADLSVGAVRESLAARSVPAETIDKLAATIEQCEFARFAPAGGATEMDGVYKESIGIISGVEDHLR